MNDDVHSRNIRSLADAMKAHRARADDQETIIKGLQNTVAQMQEQIQALQRRLAIITAERGTGATSGRIN